MKSFYYPEVCYYTINVLFHQDHTGGDFTADFYLAVLAELHHQSVYLVERWGWHLEQSHLYLKWHECVMNRADMNLLWLEMTWCQTTWMQKGKFPFPVVKKSLICRRNVEGLHTANNLRSYLISSQNTQLPSSCFKFCINKKITKSLKCHKVPYCPNTKQNSSQKIALCPGSAGKHIAPQIPPIR